MDDRRLAEIEARLDRGTPSRGIWRGEAEELLAAYKKSQIDHKTVLLGWTELKAENQRLHLALGDANIGKIQSRPFGEYGFYITTINGKFSINEFNAAIHAAKEGTP